MITIGRFIDLLREEARNQRIELAQIRFIPGHMELQWRLGPHVAERYVDESALGWGRRDDGTYGERNARHLARRLCDEAKEELRILCERDQSANSPGSGGT